MRATLKRGAAAGVVAAGVWLAAEPLLERISGTGYSDRRLLGRVVDPSHRWPVTGVLFHLANGAAFGAAFAALGGRGALRGVVAAEVENALAWPGMVLIDRIHPDRRSGAWPPLAGNPLIFAQEAAAHALFGAVLGGLLRAPRS